MSTLPWCSPKAHKLALTNPNIEAEMIEAQTFMIYQINFMFPVYQKL